MSLGKKFLKIVFLHIFIKSGSIYIKRRPKWSAVHSTHIVEYISPVKICFVLWYLSVCLSHAFDSLNIGIW